MRRKMAMVTLLVPKNLLKYIDELVRKGYYPNRSEAIRLAIRDLIFNTHKNHINVTKNE